MRAVPLLRTAPQLFGQVKQSRLVFDDFIVSMQHGCSFVLLAKVFTTNKSQQPVPFKGRTRGTIFYEMPASCPIKSELIQIRERRKLSARPGPKPLEQGLGKLLVHHKVRGQTPV